MLELLYSLATMPKKEGTSIQNGNVRITVLGCDPLHIEVLDQRSGERREYKKPT